MVVRNREIEMNTAPMPSRQGPGDPTDQSEVATHDSQLNSSRPPYNVVHKRVGHTSEWVKILHILHSTTHHTSNIEDMETKQIALSSTYPNSMFA